jgi:hypothetical protein
MTARFGLTSQVSVLFAGGVLGSFFAISFGNKSANGVEVLALPS